MKKTQYQKMKQFYKFLLYITISGAAVQPMMGIPARPGIIRVTQPDGEPMEVYLVGDENFHYYVEAESGGVLLRDGDTFYPAQMEPSGRLVAARQSMSQSKIKEQLMRSPIKRRSLSGLVEGTTFPAIGAQKAVVVLVEYQDVKFNLSDPLDYFTRMLNEEGFSDYRATGSARDWFSHSSGGTFTPQFDVYGPVTLQKTRDYYGGNDAWGQDNAPQKMVIEACRQLNPEVDFSQYDRDGDGLIDNVFVVYAGRGEASGGSSDCVWPHAWRISSAEPGMVYQFDGVKLERYACSNEWELSDLGHGYRPVGIGTFVHEFSHVMGLPDLYSTSYEEDTFTPGAWSAMDYGPYNNDGCTPPQYSAWERTALGYLEPTVLSGTGNIALRPLESGDAYMIPTSVADEYFILENRQQNGWDEFVPGHGMLVWHIDYDAEVWRKNSVNNVADHNHVDIIEADGVCTTATRDGDSFPGTAGVTELSYSTSPSLRSWSNENLGVVISDITEIGDRLVFRLNGGASDIEPPSSAEAVDILAGGFTARWREVEGALGYTLTLYGRKADKESAAMAAGATSGDLDMVLGRWNVGLTNSYVVTGLVPATDYRFSVTADDGFFGSVECESVEFRTLDPTFDYFAPVAKEAEEIGTNSFIASWEAMEEAKTYFLDVYFKKHSQSVVESVDFTGGVESLPPLWTSTSTASYGMASYSGESAPSLRLSVEGDEIVSAPYGNGIERLSFWHRGNSTSDDETLEVSMLKDGLWYDIETVEVVTEKGGTTTDIEINDDKAQRIRITFKRPTKGAVAIDDIKVYSFGPLYDVAVEGFTEYPVGKACSMKVTGLMPGTTYYYSLVADNGTLRSLRSNVVAVTTRDESSIFSTERESLEIPFAINGRVLHADIPVAVYDIAGRMISAGTNVCILPSAGIYLVCAPGARPTKVMVTD